ncbi:MAG: hypothetical protein J6L03_03090 [Bacteroidaceae bacterium]|nr:hypothetical protein [Bacteroidaceae bacterium]
MKLTYEYDETTTYEVEVPDEMYEAATGDDPNGEVAYELAEYIQEANWEALELIAEWMNEAADKGHKDALYWLQDYYSVDPAEPYS